MMNNDFFSRTGESGPVLVLSDIHGNFDALKAVFRHAAGRFQEIWVLGDVAGYGPEPGKCLTCLRERGALIVAGNHDWGVGGRIGTEAFSPAAREALMIHRISMKEPDKRFLAELPEIQTRRSVTLVHGRPDNAVWGYVLNDRDAAAVLSAAVTSLTLCGHSHFRNLWSMDTTVRSVPVAPDQEISYAGSPHLANPGSTGQPRDGRGLAQYMLVHPERKTIVFRECRWNRRITQRKMKKAGYQPHLIKRMLPG